MSENTADNPPPLVERWLREQQQWQRTLLGYLDSMAKNEDFLVHLGNAMRGSLLAGKAYPSAAPPGTEPAKAPPDRVDEVLFLLHRLEGHVQDLSLAVDELRRELRPPATRSAPRRRRATAASTTATRESAGTTGNDDTTKGRA